MTGRNSPSNRGAAAMSLLRRLYPAPWSVNIGPAVPADRNVTWLALPRADDPRILVPAGPARASAATLRRQLTGQRLRTRSTRRALGAVVATGIPQRFSALRLTVSGPTDAPCIEDPLREVFDADELVLTMPVGPARANRKPVLQVTNRLGQVLGFAKVGHDNLTRGLVRHEAQVLQRLAEAPTPGLRAPHALALCDWGDLTVLVLEPLDIPARRLQSARSEARLQALVTEIAGIGSRQTLAWETHPQRHRLHEGLSRCDRLSERLRSQLDRIDLQVRLPTGTWHGDLNSGNLALLSGPCPVWDWERFADDVPLGFDLLHHGLHQAITVHGLAPATAARELLDRAAPLLAPVGVAPDAATAAARAYLLTLAQRYAADDQEGAGADLGRVEDWLVPVLERPVEAGSGR